MLDETDVFEVLSFEEQTIIQQAKINLSGSFSPPLHDQSPPIPSDAEFLLKEPNQFEEEYNQPIRKRSLQAFVLEEQMQEEETQLREQLQQWLNQGVSQLLGGQEKNGMKPLFYQSYFCENRENILGHRNKPENQLQERKIKSNLLIKPSQLKLQKKTNKITLLYKAGRFYWQLDCQVQITIGQVQITIVLINGLYDQMLLEQCFIPIFAFNKYQEWQRAQPKKKEHFAQSEKLLKVYLQSYTAFLNKHYFQEFKTVLIRFSESKPHAIEPNFTKKTHKQGKRYSEELTQTRFQIGSLIQGIYNLIVSSKTNILRKMVLQRIRSMAASRKQCEHLGMMEYANSLFAKQQENWKLLAEVDFLLSLQTTQDFCLKKLESAKQRNSKEFWLKYLNFIRKAIVQSQKAELSDIRI